MSRHIAEEIPAVGTEGIKEDADLGSHITTGLPIRENMSLSTWLQTVRYDTLLDHCTSVDLPQEADVVIIGSGISGTLTALTLLQSSTPPKQVVVLEAREFCSGATGRNAGHCKPDSWRGFTKYQSVLGAEQALKILRNEQDTFEAVRKYVKDHNVDCEFWDGETLDVMMTDELAKAAAANMEAYKRAGGIAYNVTEILDPKEAERISRIKGARSAYHGKAATLHPWKLLAHVCRQALELGLNLQTWTPATALTGTANDWTVHTARGNIRTPIVVHATNAYCGHLLPETVGVIHPTPHTCNKVIPPSSFSGANSLKYSYGVIFPHGAYHSINPRQNGDGAILFGGAATNHQALVDYMGEDPARATDDSLSDWKPGMDAVRRDFGQNGFEWDSKPNQNGARVRYDYSWSGITAGSRDRVPFIGRVPRKEGQWMIAGHNGHGMARIFTLAPALAKMVQGATWAETGIPECFEVTEERLNRLRSQAAVFSGPAAIQQEGAAVNHEPAKSKSLIGDLRHKLHISSGNVGIKA